MIACIEQGAGHDGATEPVDSSIDIVAGHPGAGISHEAAARATRGIISTAMAHAVINPKLAPCAPYTFLTPVLDNIPQTLRNEGRWVVWRAEGALGKKPTKVPYCPVLHNSRASVNDTSSWGTFDQAAVAFNEGGYTGIGLVLDGSGLVGVDIDNCVLDGVVNPAATELLNSMKAAYTEMSPSGTGLRAFGYAEKLSSGVNAIYNGLKVELYSTGRYLTVTGCFIKNEPIAPLVGFGELADRIRANRTVDLETGEVKHVTADKRQAELLGRIASGDVFHDSLRDLAASLVANGMHPGAIVNHLRALMENSAAPHDARWTARVAEIPSLVESAAVKYKRREETTSGLMRSLPATPGPGKNVADQPPDATRFKVLSADDLINVNPLKWIIRGLFPASGLVALYGPSGSGKSFLTLDLAMTIAGDVDEWYGMRVTNCPVTYCVLEGETGMGKRVAAWHHYHGKPVPDALRFVTQPIDLLSVDDVPELAHAIEQVGGARGVIILDTLNRAAPAADENSSQDMGAIIAAAKRLQQLTDGLVLLVHHTGKDEGKGMRGHSSLFAALDGAIGMMKFKNAPAWTVAKSKDDATGAIHGFRLEPVVVGIDDVGDEVTSCVALPIAVPLALSNTKQLSPNQKTALEVITRLSNTADDDGSAAGIPIEDAVQAVAGEINTDAKHKRQRAKEAIQGLTLKSLIDTTETHVRANHRPTYPVPLPLLGGAGKTGKEMGHPQNPA